MGADLDRCALLAEDVTATTRPLTLPSGQERLDAAVRAVDAALVIVDTGPGFLDGGLNSNAEEDIRAFFRALAMIAREHVCAVIVIVHLNEDRTRSARGRVMGGAAWTNVPRSTLILGTPDGEDPQDTSERALAVLKANLIAGKAPDTLGLRLVTSTDDSSVAVVEWTGGRPDVRADDLTGSVGADERGERDDCAQAIEELLAGGPKPAREVEATLQKAGHAARTIRRARETLGITREAGCVYQEGFRGKFLWRLPVTDDPAPPLGNGGHPWEPVATRGPQMANTHTDVHGGASRAGAREGTAEDDPLERWIAMHREDAGGAG